MDPTMWFRRPTTLTLIVLAIMLGAAGQRAHGMSKLKSQRTLVDRDLLAFEQSQSGPAASLAQRTALEENGRAPSRLIDRAQTTDVVDIDALRNVASAPTDSPLLRDCIANGAGRLLCKLTQTRLAGGTIKGSIAAFADQELQLVSINCDGGSLTIAVHDLIRRYGTPAIRTVANGADEHSQKTPMAEWRLPEGRLSIQRSASGLAVYYLRNASGRKDYLGAPKPPLRFSPH